MASQPCLWLLPREIRDMIYGYLLSTAHTGPSSVIMPYRGPRALNTSILETSKQAFEEIMDFIIKRATVQLIVKFPWSDREMRLLRTARRLRIKYDAHDRVHVPLFETRVDELSHAVRSRTDIDEFHFRGEGRRLLPHLKRGQLGFDEPGWDRAMSLLNFRRIMKIMERLPKLNAKKSLKIGWEGDEDLPDLRWKLECNDGLPGNGWLYVEEYNLLVAQFQMGGSLRGDIQGAT